MAAAIWSAEKSFADLTWKNLQEVGTPTYTEEEMEFARQLQATVDPAIKDRDQRMYEAKEKALADGVVSRNAWEKAPLTASSDSGDVSQMMPMNLFTAVCWPVGVAPHTWQSCASAGSTIGQKGAFTQQKSLQQQHMTCIHSRNCEKKFRTNSMRRTENHMHRCMTVNKNKKK